jgi:hypothetical protein
MDSFFIHIDIGHYDYHQPIVHLVIWLAASVLPKCQSHLAPDVSASRPLRTGRPIPAPGCAPFTAIAVLRAERGTSYETGHFPA